MNPLTTTYHASLLATLTGHVPGAAELARKEAGMGFLLTVCASCLSAATTAALQEAGADNVSHVICKECFTEAMKGLKA